MQFDALNNQKQGPSSKEPDSLDGGQSNLAKQVDHMVEELNNRFVRNILVVSPIALFVGYPTIPKVLQFSA